MQYIFLYALNSFLSDIIYASSLSEQQMFIVLQLREALSNIFLSSRCPVCFHVT